MDDVAASFVAAVDARWAAFDKLPPSKRNKATMTEVVGQENAFIGTVPTAVAPRVAQHSLYRIRQHWAVWSEVATARGTDATDLVPNPVESELLRPGSEAEELGCEFIAKRWLSDAGFVAGSRGFGFRRIVCPKKAWRLD